MISFFVIIVVSVYVVNIQLANVFRDKFAPLTNSFSEPKMFSFSLLKCLTCVDTTTPFDFGWGAFFDV